MLKLYWQKSPTSFTSDIHFSILQTAMINLHLSELCHVWAINLILLLSPALQASCNEAVMPVLLGFVLFFFLWQPGGPVSSTGLWASWTLAFRVTITGDSIAGFGGGSKAWDSTSDSTASGAVSARITITQVTCQYCSFSVARCLLVLCRYKSDMLTPRGLVVAKHCFSRACDLIHVDTSISLLSFNILPFKPNEPCCYCCLNKLDDILFLSSRCHPTQSANASSFSYHGGGKPCQMAEKGR